MHTGLLVSRTEQSKCVAATWEEEMDLKDEEKYPKCSAAASRPWSQKQREKSEGRQPRQVKEDLPDIAECRPWSAGKVRSSCQLRPQSPEPHLQPPTPGTATAPATRALVEAGKQEDATPSAAFC